MATQRVFLSLAKAARILEANQTGLKSGERAMRNIALNYIVIGATWLLVGMILGIVMGAREDFQFAPVHAHINLIGFACHSIFGMAYKQWPVLASSAFARPTSFGFSSSRRLLPCPALCSP
jgi:hypothetical protein